MVVNGRPLKRAKRRVTADLNDFRAFPSQSTGGDEISKGPFRSNIRLFLSKHARLPPPPSALIFSPSAMTTWRVAFRIGDQVDEDLGMEGIVEMDVVEEEVMRSRSVYCDQCRVVGWSGHPVCRKRYHFIIRNNSNPFSGYHQMCTRCGSVLHMLDSRCVSCKYEMKVEDFEDWQYRHLEDTTHLLHGVVHANGYGHLLRVNGREGGSKYLTGSDIMGFWDRLCKMLHVRKVTVMDISKKYGMEYRLLHAVTAGHPWYGGWGYEFGCGSFALTSQAYTKAVNTLSNIPLTIFFHSRSLDASFRNTISFYWSLADRKIETVRDLFRYITHLLHETHEKTQPKSKKLEKERNDPGILCAWAKHDVEKVEESMVKVLRAVGRVRWVSWKALRGATCRAAASPELLDYCLKGLGGKVSDDSMLVAVRCNPENSAIEYRLEVASNPSPPKSNTIIPSADHLLRDLNFLYDSLLDPTTMNVYKPQSLHRSAFISATKLLDCKQFVKNYDDHENFYKTTHLNPFLLPIWCHVELVNQPKGHMAPPPELLALPLTATVAELKLQATKAFQETYLIFQNFQAEQLVGYEGVDDSTKVKLLLGEKNLRVKVRGRCLGDDYKLGQFRMERGLENWIVDCACGAKDDDGERMLACDSCGVWQHTRCSGISDLDKVPVKFVCRKCSKLGMAKGRGSNMKNGRYKDNSLSGRCKDEASPASTITDTGSYGMMTTVG